MRRVFQFAMAGGAVVMPLICGAFLRGHTDKVLAHGVEYAGRITEPALRECSGVAMSPRHHDVFWTHNDSSNSEVLYAIRRNGVLIGAWKVVGAPLADWEDITFDHEGNLLLADIGDNHRCRKRIAVHRIKEPDPRAVGRLAPIEQSWLLTYPDGPRDAESLFVLGCHAYVITKRLKHAAEIYRFPLSTNTCAVLELVTELDVGSAVTSAALSPDSSTLAVVSAAGAFAYHLDGALVRGMKLQRIYQNAFPLAKREGCTFTHEGLLTTSEGRDMHLFTADVFRVK
jgi:hypothetical protein